MKKRIKLLLLTGVFTISSLQLIPGSNVFDCSQNTVSVKAAGKKKSKTNTKTTDQKGTNADSESASELETKTEVAEKAPQTEAKAAEKAPQTEPQTEPQVAEAQEAATENHTDQSTDDSTVDNGSEVITTPETEAPPTEPSHGSDSEAGSESGTGSEVGADFESESGTETGSESETESESESETESESVKTDTTETDKKKKETDKETEEETEDAAENYLQITGEPIYVNGSYPIANVGENTNLIYDFLTKELKLNHAAACGVLANIQCESNFATTAVGDGGTSYGLCQWHLERFSSLIAFCINGGYDFHMMEGQLKYMSAELHSGYSDVLQYLLNVPDTAEGAYNAAYFWCQHYEMPSHAQYNSELRADLAEHEFYPKKLGVKKSSKTTKKNVERNYREAEVIVMKAPEDLKAIGVHEALDTVFVDELIRAFSRSTGYVKK